MRKFLCSFGLFVAVGVLVASVSPVALAQQKDKKNTKKTDKTEIKKDDTKTDKLADPGKIEVYQGKDGWRFRVVGPDGKSVAIGLQGYAKKEDCLAAVEVLKTTLAKAKVTELDKDKKE